MWTDQDFQTSHAVGRPHPYNITCPAVNYQKGDKPKSCTLGSLPRYSVSACQRDHVAETIRYAREHNIRLAVSGTGHDLLGRSDGYSSLQVWLRDSKNGIHFQKTFHSQNECSRSGWSGSAIKIDGNYQWRDVHKVAKREKVIVVGGGSVSPGAIGGWASGGGHGPASRNYGMGADQILEAEVMLSNGSIVLANACENSDLYRALRGGGPGYGVTLSSTIKAYPDVDIITAHKLVMAPLEKTELNADLLDAVATLLQSFSELNDAGFAGYGFWFRNYPKVFAANATSGYNHGIWTIGKCREEAEEAWKPVRKALSKFEDQLHIEESWKTYNDYWSFYEAESAHYDPVGTTSVLTSRLFDPESMENFKQVRDTIEITSGKPDAYDPNVVLLVSGGQVFEDAQDEYSGLHPAWRNSHFAIVSSVGLPTSPTNEQRQAANDQATYVKGKAAEKLAPGTGGYMNEGDRHDPNYKQNFYGDLYGKHLQTKHKYDPDGLFYCPTCVGSDEFRDHTDGPLCRRAP